MGSVPQTVITTDNAMELFAKSQGALADLQKSWAAAMKKPDLQLEEPLNDMRSLITFISLIHGGDKARVTDWVDKHKTQFFQGVSNQSQAEMLTASSFVVTTKLSAQTTRMSEAIKTLDDVTTSARNEQTHFTSIETALVAYKAQLQAKELEQLKLVTNQEGTVKNFQSHVDALQRALEQAKEKLESAEAKEKDMDRPVFGYLGPDGDGGSVSAYAFKQGMNATVERLHQEVNVTQTTFDSVKEQLDVAKGERDTANTKLTSLRNDVSTVHTQVDAASKAITSCDASAAESGKASAQLKALHDPWKSLQDSAVNLTTWARGLKKASGFAERLVLEVRVLQMVNQAVAMQDEPGVRNACSQILGDIVSRNQWAQQGVILKTKAEESVLVPFAEIKDRLGLNGQDKKSLVPLLESKFPSSETLIDLD
ncbi:hypothetical protein F4782DRAFT_535929 [Xylaria castorea]|nr:hypothetical protein F4782DRAFT_535929 [Xylaria castorea]